MCEMYVAAPTAVLLLQVQVLESCLGRRFEGVTDAVLEMVSTVIYYIDTVMTWS
jgi:hypothetical protein